MPCCPLHLPRLPGGAALDFERLRSDRVPFWVSHDHGPLWASQLRIAGIIETYVFQTQTMLGFVGPVLGHHWASQAPIVVGLRRVYRVSWSGLGLGKYGFVPENVEA